MWVIRTILIAAIIIAVVAFAYFNLNPDQKVDVDLIQVKYLDVPLITIVFWSFVGGIIISLVLFVSVYIKQAVDLRSGRRRIRDLEHELTVLRNRPIEESADLIRGSK